MRLQKPARQPGGFVPPWVKWAHARACPPFPRFLPPATRTLRVCLTPRRIGWGQHFAEQLWRGIHTAVNREGCTLVACPRFVRDDPFVLPLRWAADCGRLQGPAPKSVCEDCGAVFMLKGDAINLALPHRGSQDQESTDQRLCGTVSPRPPKVALDSTGLDELFPGQVAPRGLG
jgi:hypothetical protein